MNFKINVVLCAALLLIGCGGVPKEGSNCNSDKDDAICESETDQWLYYCSNSDETWVRVSCITDLCQPDTERPNRHWVGECSFSESAGHDVCWCDS